MSLTQEQIEKLSKNLSKINVDDPKLIGNINDILSYFDLLWEVDTTWVASTNSVVKKESILREDREVEKTMRGKDLLGCSSQKIIQNQIAISNIM